MLHSYHHALFFHNIVPLLHHKHICLTTVVFCLSTMLYYLITLPTLPVRGSSVPPQSESLFLIIFNSSISVPLSHHSGLSYHSFLSAHNNAILFYHNAPLSHHTGLLSHNDIPFSHHNSPTSCHHTVLFITVYHCLIRVIPGLMTVVPSPTTVILVSVQCSSLHCHAHCSITTLLSHYSGPLVS